MKKRLWIFLAMLLIIPGLLFTTGCKKSAKATADQTTEAVEEAAVATEEDAEEIADDSEQAIGTVEEATEAVTEQVMIKSGFNRANRNAKGWMPGREMADIQIDEEEARAMTEEKVAELRANFYFDGYSIPDSAQKVLKKIAVWMEYNPESSVVIQGHTDERGDADYNKALGADRAELAKKFLIELGVDETRLSTVSYGEERPLDEANSIAAWRLNRRINFVVK